MSSMSCTSFLKVDGGEAQMPRSQSRNEAMTQQQRVHEEQQQQQQVIFWVPMIVPANTNGAQWSATPACGSSRLRTQEEEDGLWDTTWETVLGPPTWGAPRVPRQPQRATATVPFCVEDSYEPRAVWAQQRCVSSSSATSILRPSHEQLQQPQMVAMAAEKKKKGKKGEKSGAEGGEPGACLEDSSSPGRADTVVDGCQQDAEDAAPVVGKSARSTRGSRRKKAAASKTDRDGGEEDANDGDANIVASPAPRLQASDDDDCSSPLPMDANEPREKEEGEIALATKKHPPLTEFIEVDGKMVPSIGSLEHELGTCKRCCFFPKGRCRNGTDCEFCHLEHEPRKRVKKKKSTTATEEEEELEEEEESHDETHNSEEEEGEAQLLCEEVQASEEEENSALVVEEEKKLISSDEKADEVPMSKLEVGLEKKFGVGAEEEPQEGGETTTVAEDDSEPDTEDSATTSEEEAGSSAVLEDSPCCHSSEEEEGGDCAPPRTPVRKEVNPPQEEESVLESAALRILRYFEDDRDLGSACKDWREQIFAATSEVQAQSALRALLVSGLEDARKAPAARSLASGLVQEGCVAKAELRRVLKTLKAQKELLQEIALDNPKSAELLEEFEDLVKKASKSSTVSGKPVAPRRRSTSTTCSEQPRQVSPPSTAAATKETRCQDDRSSKTTAAKSSSGAAAATGAPWTKKSAGDTDDAEVARSIKSILNKLTVEKFDRLTEKLLACGLSTEAHLELLTAEVFEKATGQHHFIQMYSELCVRVEAHFAAAKEEDGDDSVAAESKKKEKRRQFRQILLNECQRGFEKCLVFGGGGGEEARTPEEEEARDRQKARMLGNIKFVGHLLAKKMLASRVLLMVAEELIGHGDEALELLVALLTIASPTFDLDPRWAHRPHLRDIFERLRKRCAEPSLPPRLRCLLQDLLDLRTAGWDGKHRKAGQQAVKRDAPQSRAEVRRQWAEELGSPATPVGPTATACSPPRS